MSDSSNSGLNCQTFRCISVVQKRCWMSSTPEHVDNSMSSMALGNWFMQIHVPLLRNSIV